MRLDHGFRSLGTIGVGPPCVAEPGQRKLPRGQIPVERGVQKHSGHVADVFHVPSGHIPCKEAVRKHVLQALGAAHVPVGNVPIEMAPLKHPLEGSPLAHIPTRHIALEHAACKEHGEIGDARDIDMVQVACVAVRIHLKTDHFLEMLPIAGDEDVPTHKSTPDWYSKGTFSKRVALGLW